MGDQAGADYLKSSYYFKSDDVDNDLKSEEWASFIGYKFDFPIRVYGGYIFTSDAETELNNWDADFKGYGAKLGVGWVVQPWLNLNFEYRRVTLDDREIDGEDSDDKGYLDSYMLSLSFPIEF